MTIKYQYYFDQLFGRIVALLKLDIKRFEYTNDIVMIIFINNVLSIFNGYRFRLSLIDACLWFITMHIIMKNHQRLRTNIKQYGFINLFALINNHQGNVTKLRIYENKLALNGIQNNNN